MKLKSAYHLYPALYAIKRFSGLIKGGVYQSIFGISIEIAYSFAIILTSLIVIYFVLLLK